MKIGTIQDSYSLPAVEVEFEAIRKSAEVIDIVCSFCEPLSTVHPSTGEGSVQAEPRLLRIAHCARGDTGHSGFLDLSGVRVFNCWILAGGTGSNNCSGDGSCISHAIRFTHAISDANVGRIRLAGCSMTLGTCLYSTPPRRITYFTISQSDSSKLHHLAGGTFGVQSSCGASIVTVCSQPLPTPLQA